MPYKAVVFDLDGTLIDTRRFVDVLESAYHELFPRRPRRPHHDFVRCYPMSGPQIFDTLGVPEAERPAFQQQIRHEEQRLGVELRLFAGIEDTVTALQKRGCLLGINTSRVAEVFHQALAAHGGNFWELFPIRITADAAPRPKPAPDTLLLFCERAGLPPKEVLFVGDSLYDSQCAHSAGCDFAAAGWGEIKGALAAPLPARYHLTQPAELLALL